MSLPEQRLAGVIEIGPALLDAAPDDDGGDGCRLLGDWGLRSAAVLAYWCRAAQNPRRFLEGARYPITLCSARGVSLHIFWLKNRQGQQWREKQLVEIADPLASLTPEQRLAQVVDIMAKARALLDATPDDVTDAEYEEVEP